MATDLISLTDALTLVASIPTVIDSDGAKRIAESIEIVRKHRPAGDTWRIQIPRSRAFTLPTGAIVNEPLPAFSHDIRQVITDYVTIGGYRIPVVLAHAILGAYFVALEQDTLTVTSDPDAVAP